MKLYLSSYRIPAKAELFAMLPKPPDEAHIAIIPNAKDFRPEREKKLHELSVDLGKLGLSRQAWVDLNDYDHPDDLLNELSRFDALYLCGGNNFDLNYAIRKHGHQEVIKKLAMRDMVIIGESAGATVMGKTLKGYRSDDDPPGVPKLYSDGLGLVSAMVIPHADSPRYADRAQKLLARNPSAIVLNDNQAYVVNSETSRIVTGE